MLHSTPSRRTLVHKGKKSSMPFSGSTWRWICTNVLTHRHLHPASDSSDQGKVVLVFTLSCPHVRACTCSRHDEPKILVRDVGVGSLLGVGLNHHGMTLENTRAQSCRAECVTWFRCFVNAFAYLSSSCTGCHQAVLSSLLLQPVRHCGHQPTACGTKRVTQRQRAPPQVELLHGRSSNLQTVDISVFVN